MRLSGHRSCGELSTVLPWPFPQQIEIDLIWWTVRLRGDFDAKTANSLDDLAIICFEWPRMTVDLSRVGSIDAEALHHLLDVKAFLSPGAPFVLRDPRPTVRRLLDVVLPDADGLVVVDVRTA